MTDKKKIRVGLLGLMLSLMTAASGGAQESPSQDKKPASREKNIPSLLDSKVVQDSRATAATAALLESAYDGDLPPEAVRMLVAILRGGQMGLGKVGLAPPTRGIPGNGLPTAMVLTRPRAASLAAASAGRRPGSHASTATRMV
jgi:hypothetical protein